MGAEHEYVVGRRYLHAKSGLPVTLRYIGSLPPASSTASPSSSSSSSAWFGIEYDDASRGKHSGTHNGLQIFTTRSPGAGSFVKLAGRPLLPGPTFGDAVAERYGVDLGAEPRRAPGPAAPVAASTPTAVTLGDTSIRVEAPNMADVAQRVGQLGRVREMGLDGCWVSGLGETGRAAQRQLTSLRRLDLSRNLLEWADVAEIASGLPSLRELVLNGSRFDETCETIPHVTELHLGDCALSWAEAARAAALFPALEVLHLSANPIHTCPPAPALAVRHLSLSHCPLAEWSELAAGPGSIPTLEHVDLSFTPLASIPPPGRAAFPRLSSLTWFGARIAAHSLDALDGWTGGRLRAVRITFDGAADDERELAAARAAIVARLAGVETVNGTPVTPAERRDAEAAYVAAAEAGGEPGTWRRYAELVRVHGAAAPPAPEAGATLGSRMLSLTIHAGDDAWTVRALPSSSVGVLRRKAARRAGRAGALWTARPADAGGAAGEAPAAATWERACALDDTDELGSWAASGDHLLYA